MRTDWSAQTEDIFQSALKLCNVMEDADGRSRITSEHAAICLDAFGPIISLLLATQDDAQIERWFYAVRGVLNDKNDFLTKERTQ